MGFFKNRTIFVLIISIPLLAIISLVKPNSFKSVYKVEYDRFWTYKVHSKKKFNMMILGDSRVYRGISPQTINKVLPDIRINNFGFSSGILNNEMYSEADKRIIQNGGIKIILIGISPGCLIDFENDHFHELIKYTKSEIFDKIYTNYYTSKFFAPVKPSELFNTENPADTLNLKEVFYDNGWVASTTGRLNHMQYVESYKKFWSNNKVSNNKIEELYAKISEWTGEGVNVFAFRAPASVEIDEVEDELSGFKEADLMHNIILNGGHWISLNDKYKRYISYDGCHLIAESASLLSEDLALEMKRVLLMNNEMKH